MIATGTCIRHNETIVEIIGIKEHPAPINTQLVICIAENTI